MKYRMYIDEVGNPDIESSDNPNHRFLSLTGIIIDLEYVGNVIHAEMENIKAKYFNSHPDDPVVFHRKELVNQKHPFEILKSIIIRNEFNNDLLELLSFWNYEVVTVCLDKKRHKET